MTSDEVLSSNCPKCGAPLTRKGNMLLCEYCGSMLPLPDEFTTEQRQPPLQRYSAGETVETNEANLIEFDDFSTVPPPIRKKIGLNSKQVGVLLGIILLITSVCCFLIVLRSRKSVPEKTGDIQIDFANLVYAEYTNSEKRPAVFKIDPETISLAIVLNSTSSISANYHTKFDIFIQNNMTNAIDINARDQHVEMENLSVVDSNGHQYLCEYRHAHISNTLVKTGEIIKSGQIGCYSMPYPEAQYLDMAFNLSNWGQYQLQIPLKFDPQSLTVDYTISLNSSFYTFEMDFSSDPPQLFSLYQEDISIYDNKDRRYPNDSCSGNFKRNDNGKFYSRLILSQNSPLDSIECRYYETLPLDVNEITIDLKSKGEHVTATIPIDKVSGTIHFSSDSNQP